MLYPYRTETGTGTGTGTGTDLGVLTQTIPMWQKNIHSWSFWLSQEQRFSRRGAAWTSPGGSSIAVGLETQDAGDRGHACFKHTKEEELLPPTTTTTTVGGLKKPSQGTTRVVQVHLGEDQDGPEGPVMDVQTT